MSTQVIMLNWPKKQEFFGNVYYNLFEMAMGAEVNGNLVHVSEDKITAAIEPKIEQAQLEEPEVLSGNSIVN